MKKTLSIILALCLVFTMTSVAFAADTTLSGNSGSAPVVLVIDQSADTPSGGDEPIIITPTTLSVTISEKVTITADSNGVSASDFTVTNNTTGSAVTIDKLALADEGNAGWTKAAYDKDAFAGYAVGAKKYALKAKIGSTKSHDLYTDWTNVAEELSVNGGTATVTFDALVSQVSAAVSEVQIGTLTVTLG